jgi:hypothetical protein
MKRRHLLASLALTVGAGLAAPLASGAPAGAEVLGYEAFATTGTALYAVSTPYVEIGFTVPPQVSAPKTITGLQAGETILGIDVRPTTGQLFGLGSTSRLYVIDPTTAAATAVGAPFSPALVGTSFGFDFNPTVDRIRVTSNTGQNLRLNPNNGTLAANDGALNGAGVSLDGSAYTNSNGTATSTTLYGISALTGQLYIQNPPNNGTLVSVESLGLGMIAPNVGFDILASGSTNKGVAALTVNGLPGLYEINLATGAATLLGPTSTSFSGFALANPRGYCGADFDGQVRCVGGAGGARPLIPGLADEIVDAVQTPSGQGVWQAAFDGGVFTSGDAEFFGSAGGLPLQEPVVGIAPTPSGRGYWLVAADGGVFAYGDALFFGSVPGVLAPGQSLNQAVVGIVGTGTGRGYWMVAEDGGIFAFGDATFFGSVPGVLAPGQELAEPVIGIARNEVGPGYYMVAFDGGVFAFGAPFLGSPAGLDLLAPVTDIASAGPVGGYRIFSADGGVFSYGAPFRGAITGLDFGVGLAG